MGLGALFQTSGTLFPELESAAHTHIAQVESEGLISECFLASSGVSLLICNTEVSVQVLAAGFAFTPSCLKRFTGSGG